MLPGAAERLPALYLLALTRMNLGDWANAGALFEDLHGKYPVLAPYCAHYAARCRLRRGDGAGAIEWAERVPPRSVLEAETVLIGSTRSRRRCASRRGGRGGALPRALPGGASARRGDVPPGRGARAARAPEGGGPRVPPRSGPRRRWRGGPGAPRIAWARSPGGPAGDAGPSPLNATADEWMTRAMILFDRNQSVDAEAAFGAALAGAPAIADEAARKDLVCKAQFHRAQAIFKQRQRARAVPVFALAQTACQDAGNKDLLIKALYQGARCQATAGQREAALTAYARIDREARRPQLRRRRLPAGGRAVQRRRRRRARPRRCWPGPDPLPDRGPGRRGALAAGAGGDRGPALGGGSRVARREPHAHPARGALVRRGARALLEGARLRAPGAPRTSALRSTRGRCASTRCRSTRSSRSSGCAGTRPIPSGSCCASCARAPRRSRTAWRSTPRPLFGIARLPPRGRAGAARSRQ